MCCALCVVGRLSFVVWCALYMCFVVFVVMNVVLCFDCWLLLAVRCLLCVVCSSLLCVVYCGSSFVCCWLVVDVSLLSFGCCVLFDAGSLLRVARWLLLVVRCALFVAVVYCLAFCVVCGLSFVVCGSLFVVCCVLFVV